VKSSKTDNKSGTEASYAVSYRIVIVGEAHTFEGTVIKPCAMEVTICVLREQSKKKLFKRFIYVISLLNVALMICQQIEKNSCYRFFVGTGRINRRVRASSKTCILTLLIPEQSKIYCLIVHCSNIFNFSQVNIRSRIFSVCGNNVEISLRTEWRNRHENSLVYSYSKL